MNFIIDNLYTFFLPLLILILAITTYQFRIHSKDKKSNQKKLAMVYNEIEIEKTLSISYKENDTIIQSLEKKTQSKFLKIKVDLINIDFTHQEICDLI